MIKEDKMRRIQSVAMVLLVLLLAVGAFAEGPVVTSAYKLAWDYVEAPEAPATEFRLYLSRTAGIVPDGNPTTIVGPTEREWIISSVPGQWHAVVTILSDTVESGPSNEVAFFVLPPPTNLRVEPVVP